MFLQKPKYKKNSFVKSKLKLRPSLPPLFDGSNVPLTSDFDKTSFLNNSFQSVFKKDHIKTKFKDKIKRKPEKIPSTCY